MKKKLLVFAALLVLALAVAGIASAKDVSEGAAVDWGEIDSITSISGHPITALREVVDPTCETDGKAIFTCDVGDTTHDHYVKIKALGHAWSSKAGIFDWGRVEVQPTCTDAGYAIDICLRPGCGAENHDVTRTIAKKQHEYDTKHYDVVKKPGCGEDGEGLGWKTCIWCGERHPDTTTGEHLVLLPKVEHTWTDWRVDEESTCWSYGLAARTCIACGATQHLSEYEPVVDQGKTITIGDVLPMKNEAWNVNGQKLAGNIYTEYQALQDDLAACKFEYEVMEDYLDNCHVRWIIFACPYCHGTYHEPFKVSLVYPATNAHIWNEERDPYLSVPAWCTTDGYDIFLCKYDDLHGHENKEDYKKVVTKAVGHDWSAWEPAEVFTKDGKKYMVSFRTCNRCGASEQKTEEATDNIPEQGLYQVDGKWVYMVDGEIATGVTKLIPYEGGEFWVVNGYVATDANGLTICPDGKAYFLVYGQVARVTQWAEYGGKWFIISNGLLNPVTGLENYNGGTFAVETGRKLDVDGLWQDPRSGKWAYMENGQVLDDFSGEVTYNGATFTVVDGYVVK